MSPKQAKLFQLIQEELARTGRPPTYRDLARRCGYDAVGTVQDHVRALIQKGFLRKQAGVARGLELAHRCESSDIPILGSVPAGRPLEAITSSEGLLPVPSRLKGELFALKVSGESMIEAGIMDGDYVIVRQQSDATDGDIVVAMIGEEATVKFLEKKRGRIRLLPANPKFSPIELEFSIKGKVVSVQRYYSP
ncbi:MAG: transcriptional repressor LexA [Oligoflexia bacterium]|nr:transcriptional repressor LexA [Oligoflexia bacterium]